AGVPDLTDAPYGQRQGRWVEAEPERLHEGLAGSPAERGDEIGVGDEPGHHQEVRHARADATPEAPLGESDIDRAYGVATLRNDDVIERDVACERELLADLGMVLPHDADVLVLE